MKYTELLAPAGDFNCLTAAFNAGADAVYLAGKMFGARAFAGNFEKEELIEALDYAHLLSKKIYLTLNTLIKETEFSQITEYLTPYYEHGLDGVIIQDLGLIPLLQKEFPLLELHASTQMTVNNYRSALWLKENGVCRVVPSRELSLEELREIKEKAGVEVEAFIHGAMCYGYSGQCLFSSFLGGRSGNRGRCAQPCRLPYRVQCDSNSILGNKEIYPLSLKDLCSLPYIYELMDAGIDSFKIEGRMKSPEYVAGVTAVYRKYMDYYNEGHRPSINRKDLEQLSHLYIRSEMKDGYMKKHNGKDMISLSSPSYQGCDDVLIEKLREQYCNGKIKLPITGILVLKSGEPAMLTLFYKEKSVVTYGETVQTAANRPLSESDVKKQILKTGNSVFLFDELTLEIGDTVFMPVKQLNELRRKALQELQSEILKENMRIRSLENRTDDIFAALPECENAGKDIGSTDNTEERISVRISVYTAEQLKAVLNSDISAERCYVPADLFYLQKTDAESVIAKGREKGISIFLSLPRILRKRDEAYLEFIKQLLPLFEGVLAKNTESLYFLQEQKYSGHIITDTMIYNWNKSAFVFLDGFRDEFCYPLELSFRECKELGRRDGEYVVYGRTPMMVSANCIRKTMGQCDQKKNSFDQSLTDRYRKELPVYANCVHCYNEVFNAVSMSLHKEIPALIKNNFRKIRLDFTNETIEEMMNLLRYYQKKSDEPENRSEFPIKEFTSGHYIEGAI